MAALGVKDIISRRFPVSINLFHQLSVSTQSRMLLDPSTAEYRLAPVCMQFMQYSLFLSHSLSGIRSRRRSRPSRPPESHRPQPSTRSRHISCAPAFPPVIRHLLPVAAPTRLPRLSSIVLPFRRTRRRHLCVGEWANLRDSCRRQVSEECRRGCRGHEHGARGRCR